MANPQGKARCRSPGATNFKECYNAAAFNLYPDAILMSAGIMKISGQKSEILKFRTSTYNRDCQILTYWNSGVYLLATQVVTHKNNSLRDPEVISKYDLFKKLHFITLTHSSWDPAVCGGGAPETMNQDGLYFSQSTSWQHPEHNSV